VKLEDVLWMGAGAGVALVFIAFVTWLTGSDQDNDDDVFVPPHCKGELRMRVQLVIGQFIRLSVTPLTAAGQAAKIDGKPKWAPSTMGVAALHVSKDGSRAIAHARGVGTVNVVCDVDADLGAGVRTIRTSIDIDVVEPEAADLVLDAHVPEEGDALAEALAELDEESGPAEPETPADPVETSAGTTTTTPATSPNGADMGAAPADASTPKE
jgi:hypothetical protein